MIISSATQKFLQNQSLAFQGAPSWHSNPLQKRVHTHDFFFGSFFPLGVPRTFRGDFLKPVRHTRRFGYNQCVLQVLSKIEGKKQSPFPKVSSIWLDKEQRILREQEEEKNKQAETWWKRWISMKESLAQRSFSRRHRGGGTRTHPFCSAPIKLYILNVCDIIHHHHRRLIQKFCLLDFVASLDALYTTSNKAFSDSRHIHTRNDDDVWLEQNKTKKKSE